MRERAFPPAKLIGISLLALLVVGFLGGCKGKTSEEVRPVDQQEVFTISVLKPFLGEARADASGVLDVTGDANELVLYYRYFDVDLKNYDDDMVRELGPKIDVMFKKFKSLDRVVFQVTTNDPQVPGAWKPYVNFALNRKSVERVEWSRVLTTDFFRNVVELNRFD